AAAETDVAGAGGFAGARESRLDPVGDEMEDGATLHLEGRPRVMREDEDRHVIRRVLAPPTSPGIVRPRAANGAEHVAAHDPCAQILEPASSELVVAPGGAGLRRALHLLERPRRDEPVVQRFAAAPKRLLATLVRTGAITVERDAEPVHAHLRHRALLRGMRILASSDRVFRIGHASARVRAVDERAAAACDGVAARRRGTSRAAPPLRAPPPPRGEAWRGRGRTRARVPARASPPRARPPRPTTGRQPPRSSGGPRGRPR